MFHEEVAPRWVGGGGSLNRLGGLPMNVFAVDSPIGRSFLKLSTVCGFMRAVSGKNDFWNLENFIKSGPY